MHCSVVSINAALKSATRLCNEFALVSLGDYWLLAVPVLAFLYTQVHICSVDVYLWLVSASIVKITLFGLVNK